MVLSLLLRNGAGSGLGELAGSARWLKTQDLLLPLHAASTAGELSDLSTTFAFDEREGKSDASWIDLLQACAVAARTRYEQHRAQASGRSWRRWQ